MSPKKSKAKPKKAAKKAKPKKKVGAGRRSSAKAAKKAKTKKKAGAGRRSSAKAAKKAKPKKKAGAGRRSSAKAAKKAVKKKAKAARKPVKKTAKAKATRKPAKKTAKAKVAKKAVKKTAKGKVPQKPAKRQTTRKVAPGPEVRSAPPATKGGTVATVVVKSAPAPAAATKGAKGKAKGRTRRRSARRAIVRRGPDGEILAPGDLLLPGGPKGEEETQYLFRGCMAAEHPVAEEAIEEILAKRGVPEGPGEREELQRAIDWAQERFGGGDVEPIIPIRNNLRRTFQGVVDRARQRRREIGAFLRGLDMGHTETSHMDAHGEASLQSLMEWAARLENLVENLAETPETNQAHYTQFHRVLDQLEATTEALVIDVEQTLRRLRDRLEA
jgi:hypothetical protein